MFNIKKLDLIISLYIFCIVVSELMGAKTFPLFTIAGFKLNASVAIFTIPIIFSANDIIVEVYGKERARSLIRSSIFIIAFLLLFTILATSLPPSGRFAQSESAYDLIFTKAMRFSIASLVAFITAEFLDVYIFAKIREKMGKKALWLRNNVSNFISQFIDTAVFMTLAFYTLGQSFGSNFAFLAGLILPYWLLKCSMSVLETPLVYLGVNWLKKDERKKL